MHDFGANEFTFTVIDQTEKECISYAKIGAFRSAKSHLTGVCPFYDENKKIIYLPVDTLVFKKKEDVKHLTLPMIEERLIHARLQKEK